jgi:hypothetical protein
MTTQTAKENKMMFCKRLINYGLLLLMVLGMSGCLSNSGTHSDSGEVVIGITDADGDFLAYAVDVTSIKLQRADGTQVEVLPLTTRIDFSQYVELTELLNIATIPAGRYVSASMTLDYTNADIQVEKNGEAVSADVQDADGNPVSTLTVDVSLAGQNSLTIVPGVPAYLTLDFDLQSTNSVDTSGATPLVTVEPVLLADVQLEDPKEHRLRGLLNEVNVAESRIELAMRPFALRQGEFGHLDAYVDNDTVYEIDGISYSGADGLNQMDLLAANSWVIVYGSLNVAAHRFEASEVYAGSSVAGSDQDAVVGVVLARSGDQLTVDAGSIVTRSGDLIFNKEVAVTLSVDTRVTRQLSPDNVYSKDDISVGQRVALLGELNSDDSAMTTTSHARMLMNQIGATVVSVGGGLVLDLQRIDGRLVSHFDFNGTSADPNNYQIDTGALSLAGINIDDPLRVRGFVRPFGSVSPDFEATTVIAVADVPAFMLVTWTGGDASPFSSQSSSELVLDLDGSSLHHIARNWLVTDLSSLASPTTIMPRAGDLGVFAINLNGTIYVYGRFSIFEAALSELLDGGRAVKRIGAVGRFDDATATLTVTSMTVVFGDIVG